MNICHIYAIAALFLLPGCVLSAVVRFDVWLLGCLALLLPQAGVVVSEVA